MCDERSALSLIDFYPGLLESSPDAQDPLYQLSSWEMYPQVRQRRVVPHHDQSHHEVSHHVWFPQLLCLQSWCLS